VTPSPHREFQCPVDAAEMAPKGPRRGLRGRPTPTLARRGVAATAFMTLCSAGSASSPRPRLSRMHPRKRHGPPIPGAIKALNRRSRAGSLSLDEHPRHGEVSPHGVQQPIFNGRPRARILALAMILDGPRAGTQQLMKLTADSRHVRGLDIRESEFQDCLRMAVGAAGVRNEFWRACQKPALSYSSDFG